MLTWDNGTPRSRGGPFDILYAPRTRYAPTLQEQAHKRERQLSKAKKTMARDNTFFSIALTNQADADKQQRMKKADL
jgi:hypothetical protein